MKAQTREALIDVHKQVLLLLFIIILEPRVEWYTNI
jgi:hypothetical protein